VGATLPAAATHQPHAPSQCLSGNALHSSRHKDLGAGCARAPRAAAAPARCTRGTAVHATPQSCSAHAERQRRTFTRSFRYTFSLFGAVRWTFLLRPPASKSMPCAHVC